MPNGAPTPLGMAHMLRGFAKRFRGSGWGRFGVELAGFFFGLVAGVGSGDDPEAADEVPEDGEEADGLCEGEGLAGGGGAAVGEEVDDEEIEDADALRGGGGDAGGEDDDGDVGEVVADVGGHAEGHSREPCGERKHELGGDGDEESPGEDSEVAAVGVEDVIDADDGGDGFDE